jgi:uncharacterized protein YbaR (Trm112 family)
MENIKLMEGDACPYCEGILKLYYDKDIHLILTCPNCQRTFGVESHER